MPELTEDRIRFVVSEYRRLTNRLKRMPGGNAALPTDLADDVRDKLVRDVRDVFEATAAVTPEFTRIGQIFTGVLHGLGTDMTAVLPGIDPPPTDAEVRAVANTLEDIARSSPILKSMYARAKKTG
jgi:hypothetical protein